jgi:hypothetical protein
MKKDKTSATLTKTDFLLFLEAPMHLWAKHHQQMEKEENSAFQQLLIQQGQQVEDLAEAFIAALVGKEVFQRQYEAADGPFRVRCDFIIKDEASEVFDMYEVKSSTSVKKQHEYDLAFQKLVISTNLSVRDVYLVLVEKGYQYQGYIEPQNLFKLERLNDHVEALEGEVLALRQQALKTAMAENPEGIRGCSNPDSCPCPSLCHPNLPTYPIYDIPRLGKKAATLKTKGVTAIRDIPQNFPLSNSQRSYVDLVASGQPKIDILGIRALLDKLEYPLYFLDYETINPAAPLFDGYHPFDLVVFQFSLHVIDHPGAAYQHHECLLIEDQDPAPKLVGELAQVIGSQGSVVVWNKTFEARCNRSLARQVPGMSSFLLWINERLFDLMDVFSQRLYMHPDFHGSASIKKVLPVLVPELSYDAMDIQNGTQAMVQWRKLVFGNLDTAEIETQETALRKYCELDSLAMVEVWRVLSGLR